MFYPGFDVKRNFEKFTFEYGDDVFGPNPEIRSLESIRKSLKNPNADGPEFLYSIAMDVGNNKEKNKIEERNLLYGAVLYAKGQIGDEPVRSQGHIHAISPSCNASTCEVYEIWDGEAIIYMQENSGDDAGRCFAIKGKPGDVIIVPPGWVHATINANIKKDMSFGAWCVRDYGFDYKSVREHKGIAFFPVVKDDKVCWERNENYKSGTLIEMDAVTYPQFNIEKGVPIYQQFIEDNDRFNFVSNPNIAKEEWEKF